MDDERIWAFEESLWLGDAEHYRALIDDECVMVLPAEPYVYGASAALEAVANTLRWATVDLSERRIMRPEEGLIVIAYQAAPNVTVPPVTAPFAPLPCGDAGMRIGWWSSTRNCRRR